MKSNELSQKLLIPNSVAIIMDGNRRWAERRGLSVNLGHKQGAKTAENIIRYAQEMGVGYLTLFAFSSENWQRSPQEIDGLMIIFEDYLSNDIDELIKRGVKVSAIGDLQRLPSCIRLRLKEAMQKTAHCSKFIVTLALSYGAWEEIVHACRSIGEKIKNNEIHLSDISEAMIQQHLFSKDIPNPDLFIRTSGELRLSNFLLLQLSYAELYFTDVLWPDFQRKDFDQALLSFARRQRRFGVNEKD